MVGMVLVIVGVIDSFWRFGLKSNEGVLGKYGPLELNLVS